MLIGCLSLPIFTGELTPCPLPVGPTIDWDAVYQCINPYYQQFMNINNPRVPGEVSPFLTIANLIDAVGAVWDSDSLVQGMGYFCRLVAPRQAGHQALMSSVVCATLC